MNEQVNAALKRALIAAGIAAGPVVIAALRDYPIRPEYSAYVVILVRIAEGLFDSWRNAAGRVEAADVGAFAQPLPR